MKRIFLLVCLLSTTLIAHERGPWFLIGRKAASQFSMSQAIYLGAFRVPSFNNLDYCNCAMAYDPAGNGGAGSLFIATYNSGANWGGITEVTIPPPVIATSLASLNTAAILQPDVDALESRLYLSRTSDYSTPSNILGLQVRGSLIYANAGANYDGDGSQCCSFYIRSKNLTATGTLTGPFSTTLPYQGQIAGYMADVPTMYRSEVGGDTISGMWSQSIVTRLSSGPAAFAYNTSSLGPTPITPSKLIFYPSTDQLGFYNQSGGGCGHAEGCLENGDVQLVFNPGLSGHEAGVMVSGSRTIMFFGGLGVGPYCYGTGTTDPAMNYMPNGPGDIFCYDLEEYNHGTHSFPYKPYYWLYHLDDALAVKNGTLVDSLAYPYEFGDLSPFMTNYSSWYAGKPGVKGGTWDEAHRRMYLALDKNDGATVLIHVFSIP